jgi:3-oxoacid CoA-transferase subunit A
VNKIYSDINLAISDINDGCTIMSGGFGLCGNPEHLIRALHQKGVRDLTIISNNCGTTEHGLSLLLKHGHIKKMIASYVGENKIFESLYLQGDLEVELMPQGTLAEKIRAGGAGIPAFYTPTGVNTLVAEGGLPMRYDNLGHVTKTSPKKEIRVFNGREYVLEESLTADFAIVKAKVADPYGNCIFNMTAQNFNPIMATAAKTTLLEVEEIVGLGDLNPDHIHLPGVYVKRIYRGTHFEKWIEQRTVQKG